MLWVCAPIEFRADPVNVEKEVTEQTWTETPIPRRMCPLIIQHQASRRPKWEHLHRCWCMKSIPKSPFIDSKNTFIFCPYSFQKQISSPNCPCHCPLVLHHIAVSGSQIPSRWRVCHSVLRGYSVQCHRINWKFPKFFKTQSGIIRHIAIGTRSRWVETSVGFRKWLEINIIRSPFAQWNGNALLHLLRTK